MLHPPYIWRCDKIAQGGLMTNLQQQILIALIVAPVASLITSIITVRLSMHQFHSEKWWEKKDKAYSYIMEKLSELQYSLGELYDYEVGAKTPSEERELRLQGECDQAKQSMRKMATMGAYAISDDAADALEILVRDLQQVEFGGNSPSANLDRHYGSTTKCIKIVRECSIKELSKK
jgi:hypothetical protein